MAMPGYGTYGADEQEIENRRRYAEALRQQGMQPLETQMAGRVAIPISWAQGAANLLKTYSGTKGVEKAREDRRTLASERARRTAELLSGMPSARQESTAGAGMTGGLDEQDFMPGAAPGDARTVQPTMQDRAAWLGQLAQVGPEAVNMGGTLMGMQAREAETSENRAFRQREAEAARRADLARREADRLAQEERQRRDQLFRDQQARQAQLDRENIARMNVDARREVAAMTAANRPERMVTVLGPNGEALTVPQSQAQGMQLYNPQAAKQIQDRKKQGEAREQLTEVAGQLKGYYDALKEGGGIVMSEATKTPDGREVKPSTLANIGARIGSSAVGQMAGGAVGTRNQAMRQRIEQTRPLLLNLIKNATGMSAQQMNSNVELQTYLKAATDPTLTYEANMDALAGLDKLFGLGLGVNAPSAPPPTGGAPQPQGLPSQSAIDAEIARRRGGK